MLTAQLAKQSLEIQLARPKRKKEPLLKPASSGNLEKVLVVGGGLTVVYTFWATMPIAAAAAVVVMGLHFSKEIQTFQSPERAESLRLLWESKTVAHPSMLEAFKQQKLAKVYPTDAINQAVDEMSGESDWFVFQPSDNHPLANFGEVYCWQDPLDKQVMLPIEGLHKKMRQWGLAESIPTQAISVPTAAATPPENLDQFADAFGNAPPLLNEPNSIARLMHFFRLQNTLVWGGQGSGKTSLTRAIAADKLAHNQKVTVLNPHGSAATWQGMKLIGGGKDYAAVEEFMRSYLALIKKRYQIFKESGISEDDFLEQILKAGLVETTICEEASSWAENVDQELLHEFTQTGLTESRKVGLPLLIVTHDPSLSFMGLKKGARLRDKGMAIVELEPGIADLDTGFLKATGRGELQLPGQKNAIPFVFEPPTKTTEPTLEQFAQEFAATDPIPSIGRHVDAQIQESISPKKIEQISVAYQLPSPVKQLENSFNLDAVEPTAIREVPPTQNFDHLPKPLNDIARYIHSKGGEMPVATLKDWGRARRNNPLNSEAIDEALIELMELHLVSTFTPTEGKGEWVKWETGNR